MKAIHDAGTAATRGTTMLALPFTASLTEDQLSGAACPWCGRALPEGDVIHLGQRPGPWGESIYPCGCQVCVHKSATRTLATHRTACQRCQKGTECGTYRVLVRLVADTEPASQAGQSSSSTRGVSST